MAEKVSWFNAARSKMSFGRKFAEEVDRSGLQFTDPITTASLIGNGDTPARPRQLIYAKYQQMLSDPLVSGALRLHVTAALGGHETSGDLVFIEATPDGKKNPKQQKMVDEISRALSQMFNRVAMPAAYNGVSFGDAYARIYTKKQKGEDGGVRGLMIDEMLLPPLVQPYEQGERTVVCTISIGSKFREKLVMDQIARLKMQRMKYTPQPLAIEKAWRVAITEDDMDKLPVMPALAGGSFLADAEEQYDKFVAALQGLVGQRVLDSIDETIFTAETEGMTAEQKQSFLKSVATMLKQSKKIADDAVKSGRPFLARIRHILPVARGKQLLQVQGVNGAGGGGGGRAGNIGIEDVLFHAKLLCGALGIDISMLGFADLMSGGLGDGGFFRTSAQAAERSRTIRVALSDFYNHVIDVHVAYRYGMSFTPEDRPWQINFHGSISALETERQKTKLDAVNAVTMMAQCFQLVKDSGLDEQAMAHLFEREMKLDAEDAKMYAASIAKAKKEADAKEAAAGGFGPPPGGDGGGFPPAGGNDEEEGPPPGAPKPVPVGAEA